MKVIGIACLALSCAAAIAATSASGGQAKTREKPVSSLTGCLTASSGEPKGYQLAVMNTTADAPAATVTTVYRLVDIPPAAEVKTHLNHRVTVTGWSTSPPRRQAPKATAARSRSTPLELRVKDISHVADSCK